MKKFIVVGIWNNNKKRNTEYFPQKPYIGLSPVEKAFFTAELQKSGRTNEKGFSKENWRTQFFPGKEHSEKSWRERFDIPLLFLLKK